MAVSDHPELAALGGGYYCNVPDEHVQVLRGIGSATWSVSIPRSRKVTGFPSSAGGNHSPPACRCFLRKSDGTGFNGRGLDDDVMDVMLSLTTNSALGDGVAPGPDSCRIPLLPGSLSLA